MPLYYGSFFVFSRSFDNLSLVSLIFCSRLKILSQLSSKVFLSTLKGLGADPLPPSLGIVSNPFPVFFLRHMPSLLVVSLNTLLRSVDSNHASRINSPLPSPRLLDRSNAFVCIYQTKYQLYYYTIWKSTDTLNKKRATLSP